MFQTTKPVKFQSGSALVELLIVCPTLLFLGLGTVQVGLIYHAKSILNYATFEAARVGAVNHAQVDKMREELGLRMAPVYGGDGSKKKAALSILRAKTAANDTSVTKISLLTPDKSAFDDFGIIKTVDGAAVKSIPNSHLRYRDRSLGSSGKTIQQANLLTIKVTYGLRLHLPVLDMPVPVWEPTMRFIMTRLDPQRADYYRRGLLPITAKATVRMQSDAHFDEEAYQVETASSHSVLSVPGTSTGEPSIDDIQSFQNLQGSESGDAQDGLTANTITTRPAKLYGDNQNDAGSQNMTNEIDSPLFEECQATVNGLPPMLPIKEYLGTNPLSCWTPEQTGVEPETNTPIFSSSVGSHTEGC